MMSLPDGIIESAEVIDRYKRYAAESLVNFDADCKSESEKGEHSYISTVKVKSGTSGELIPLVLASVEEAEKVKACILEELSKHGYLRTAAMVYKDGPYYHNHKKRRILVGDDTYFLVKIKISASW